jgi:transposase InsO family protein
VLQTDNGGNLGEVYRINQFRVMQGCRGVFVRAIRWQWVYNTVRIHSAIKMTPYKKLL